MLKDNKNASEQFYIFIDQRLKDSSKKCKDIPCQPAVFLVENAAVECWNTVKPVNAVHLSVCLN